MPTALLACSLCAAALSAAVEPDRTEAELEWLRLHAAPLATTDPGEPLDDLAPLDAIVGEARVVGLGEATHGTREHFLMKHRIVRRLVEELGFTVFSIEASTPQAFAVDRYVTEGIGDPAQLVENMGFWTWSTQEVVDLVEWMRAYNERFPDEPERWVRFTGFDMQDADAPFVELAALLGQADPKLAIEAATLRADLSGSAPDPNRFGAGFVYFETKDFSGKQVTFTAQIRTALEGTEGVEANIWARADRGQQAAAFQTTQNNASQGDSPWREHSISLNVPADADAVTLGLLFRGQGAAWFDDVRITIDGKPAGYPPEQLGFENGHDHFTRWNPGYAASIVRNDPAEGGACLRVAPTDRRALVPLDRLIGRAEDLRDTIAANRERYEPEIGADGAAFAEHMATIVVQCLTMQAAPNTTVVRDRAMADNVLWLMDYYPQQKIVLWAHNLHIANTGFWMGAHLERELGPDYLPIGFTATTGAYRAVVPDEGMRTDNALTPPNALTIESALDAIGFPLALLDLRGADWADPASAWLKQLMPFRVVGAQASKQQFMPQAPAPAFEAIVHTAQTTATEPITRD